MITPDSITAATADLGAVDLPTLRRAFDAFALHPAGEGLAEAERRYRAQKHVCAVVERDAAKRRNREERILAIGAEVARSRIVINRIATMPAPCTLTGRDASRFKL